MNVWIGGAAVWISLTVEIVVVLERVIVMVNLGTWLLCDRRHDAQCLCVGSMWR